MAVTLYLFVAHNGFEPLHSEPKSDVLPLDEWAIVQLDCKGRRFFYFSKLST